MIWNVKSYPKGGKTPGNNPPWGPTGWKAALQKRTWVPRDNKVNMSLQCAFAEKKANGIPSQINKILPAGLGRWLFPSTKHWWGHTWRILSSSGLLRRKEMRTHWRESGEGLWGSLRDWTWEEAERVGTVQPGKKKEALRAILSVCMNIWWGGKEDGARFLLVAPSGRTRGTGHKLQYSKYAIQIVLPSDFAILPPRWNDSLALGQQDAF